MKKALLNCQSSFTIIVVNIISTNRGGCQDCDWISEHTRNTLDSIYKQSEM